MNKNEERFFRFCYKILLFQNPKKYPICDSLSAKTTEFFIAKIHFYNGRIQVEKFKDDYERYIEIVKAFTNHYSLKYGEEHEKDYKELDKFLWLVGKNL